MCVLRIQDLGLGFLKLVAEQVIAVVPKWSKMCSLCSRPDAETSISNVVEGFQ